jgi:hypothetical protein
MSDRFDDPCFFGHAPILTLGPNFREGGGRGVEYGGEVKDLQLSSQQELTVRLKSARQGMLGIFFATFQI